jgi:hypothetical protein
MRILFYGSVPRDDERLVSIRGFLDVFVRALLEGGATIVTREGTNTVDKDAHVPIDNLVLDVACSVRDQRHLDANRVVSYAESSNLQAGRCSAHDRPITRLPNSHRWDLYRELLSAADVLITVGGREGVYRLGLVAAAQGRVVLPLAFTGGKSLTLWEELAVNPDQPLALPELRSMLAAGNVPTKRQEISDFAVRVLGLGQIVRAAAAPAQAVPAVDPASLSVGQLVSALRPGPLKTIIATVVSLAILLVSGTWFVRGWVESHYPAGAALTAPAFPVAPSRPSISAPLPETRGGRAQP